MTKWEAPLKNSSQSLKSDIFFGRAAEEKSEICFTLQNSEAAFCLKRKPLWKKPELGKNNSHKVEQTPKQGRQQEEHQYLIAGQVNWAQVELTRAGPNYQEWRETAEAGRVEDAVSKKFQGVLKRIIISPNSKHKQMRHWLRHNSLWGVLGNKRSSSSSDRVHNAGLLDFPRRLEAFRHSLHPHTPPQSVNSDLRFQK